MTEEYKIGFVVDRSQRATRDVSPYSGRELNDHELSAMAYNQSSRLLDAMDTFARGAGGRDRAHITLNNMAALGDQLRADYLGSGQEVGMQELVYNSGAMFARDEGLTSILRGVDITPERMNLIIRAVHDAGIAMSQARMSGEMTEAQIRGMGQEMLVNGLEAIARVNTVEGRTDQGRNIPG